MKTKTNKPAKQDNNRKQGKLGLRRETLVTLTQDALSQVAGGAPCGGSCDGTVHCTTGTMTQ